MSLRQRKTRNATSASATTPPTAPPTIGARFVEAEDEDEEPPVEVGFAPVVAVVRIWVAV